MTLQEFKKELQKEAKRFERFNSFDKTKLSKSANWNDIEKLLMEVVEKNICNS
jgi:hypothetical protein